MELALATNSVARLGRQLFPLFGFSNLPLLICFILLTLATGNAQATSLQLTSSADKATAGYFQLTWSWPNAPADAIYKLGERQVDGSVASTSFKTIYQGIDLASVISGKANGRYEYQVMAKSNTMPESVASNVVSVTVEHHSLTNAFGVLSIGVLIFVAIVITIFRGTKRAD